MKIAVTYENGQVFQHIHLLEDKSHFLQAQIADLIAAHIRKLTLKEFHTSGCRTVHPADGIQQGCLTGAGWSHDGDHFLFFQCQIDISQYVVLSFIYDICLTQIAYCYSTHNSFLLIPYCSFHVYGYA